MNDGSSMGEVLMGAHEFIHILYTAYRMGRWVRVAGGSDGNFHRPGSANFLKIRRAPPPPPIPLSVVPQLSPC
jgi:hypothetical protein